MTATMRAIGIREPGASGVLVPQELPVPVPAAEEVLIRVKAAGVNMPDVLQRKGRYPVPKGATDIPGLEVAGEVVRAGSDVHTWKGGDAVCALVVGGGYAEYVTAHTGSCLPVPRGFSWVEAAALPETFFTVWENLFRRARFAAGESLLIHGGSSGIGTTAIQLARAAGASQIFATAGSAEKVAACAKLGADRGINYREEDFVTIVQEATGGRGVDAILDMVGGDYVQKNITCLALDGRLVNVNYMSGIKVEVDFRPVLTKCLTLAASVLRPRSVAHKAAIASQLRERVWPWLDAGKVKPHICATYALDKAGEAHALMESSKHIGKIVLTVTEDAVAKP
jgi:putative PIG3 family NAD(P)H quinone oxidoreductase